MSRLLEAAAEHLAARLRPRLAETFTQLAALPNPVRAVFGAEVVGSVDVAPLRVRRPQDGTFAKTLYSGKYGTTVLKFQAICTHSGRVAFVSGPHPGSQSDIRIWRGAGPHEELKEAGDLLIMGDKAYQSAPSCIAPVKKKRSRELNEHEQAYNCILNWYRSTSEHVFAIFKRFNIISSVFRGQLEHRSTIAFLENVLVVIGGVVDMIIERTPLKDVNPVVADDEVCCINRTQHCHLACTRTQLTGLRWCSDKSNW